MKISIITVCFNSGATIKDTIESVLSQKYQDYEYLIIDGKSKDNTMDIVKSYEKKFKGKLKYVSEKDNGLYDAINKGIKMAEGDIIGLINADDILANQFVFEKVNTILSDKNYDGLYTDLVYMNEDFSIPVRNFISGEVSKKGTWHPAHPTLYLKRGVYKKVGTFNTDYRIAADLDFMLRLCHSDVRLKYIKEYFVLMRAGGVSSAGLKGYYKNYKESNKVLVNNGIQFSYFINILRIVKTFNQYIDAKINKDSILKKIEKEKKS